MLVSTLYSSLFSCHSWCLLRFPLHCIGIVAIENVVGHACGRFVCAAHVKACSDKDQGIPCLDTPVGGRSVRKEVALWTPKCTPAFPDLLRQFRLFDLTVTSARKLLFEQPATVGWSLCVAATRDVSYDSLVTELVLSAVKTWLDMHAK